MVKISYCIVKVESRESENFEDLKKEGASHDIMSGVGGGRRVSVTMTLIFSQIVWMCSLNHQVFQPLNMHL